MKTFLIRIKVNVPYPKEFEYRINAIQAHVATARAFKLLRKDLPRKRIDHYSISVTRLITLS